MRKAMHLSLALLVTAGSGVFANARTADTPASKPKATTTATSKTGGKTTRRSSKKVSSRRKQKGQMAPAPERITEIQQALAKDGSFGGSPNGKWDDTTVEAMKKFQSTHGLNASGKLDARSLEKLGLGSQTAGIAEPVAPPNSTSRLTSAAQPSTRQ
jgi:peptidoglycan hydrolase-like protein with peptidoglycan-binding domain